MHHVKPCEFVRLATPCSLLPFSCLNTGTRCPFSESTYIDRSIDRTIVQDAWLKPDMASRGGRKGGKEGGCEVGWGGVGGEGES